MKPHRFLAFLAILLCGSNCLQAQDADPETAAGVRQRHIRWLGRRNGATIVHGTSRRRRVYSLAIGVALLLFAQRGGAQNIAYILPDIGSPGMTTYVEGIGPADNFGNFGPDGLYLNNVGDPVRIACMHPADTHKIKIGPMIVGWGGRMFSTQIFVLPYLTPSSPDWRDAGDEFTIPLCIIRDGMPGDTVLFRIVQPTKLPLLRGEVTLGEGNYGIRSPRGAMMVEQLRIENARVTVSTNDCDTAAVGNQGYLPFTLLSAGDIRGTGSAVLDLSALASNGGPGGGGGGGSFCYGVLNGAKAGEGFTSGGAGGRNPGGALSARGFFTTPSEGSGALRGSSGGSLNGVPGGAENGYHNAGGGTGHPFGSSGIACAMELGCQSEGGYGGGSGIAPGGERPHAGYGSDGGAAGMLSHGRTHGNPQLIPLAGGSGGAGGTPSASGDYGTPGGGGGGAISLSALSIEGITVVADGADVPPAQCCPGGSGSGGGAVLSAKNGLTRTSVSVLGADPKGEFGRGRVRLDGPSLITTVVPGKAFSYRGPTTDTTRLIRRSAFSFTGTGDGNRLRLYLKSTSMPWTQIATVFDYPGSSWSISLELPGNDQLYFLVAVQEQPQPVVDWYAARPRFVMGQGATNMLFNSEAGIKAVQTGSSTSVTASCEDVSTDTVVISNVSDSRLTLRGGTFLSSTSLFSFDSSLRFPLVVAAKSAFALPLRIDGSGRPAGTYRDTLRLETDDILLPGTRLEIPLNVRIDSVGYELIPSVLDFGRIDLCDTRIADREIFVRNTGTRDAVLAQPSLGFAGLRVVAPTLFPLTIPAGGVQRLTLRFSPEQYSGVLNGNIQLMIGLDPCTEVGQISCIAGTDTSALSAASVVDFGRRGPANLPAESYLPVTNTGTLPLTVTGLRFDDGRTFRASAALPLRLAPGESGSIRVEFPDPQVPGRYNDELHIETQPDCASLLMPVQGERSATAIRITVEDAAAAPGETVSLRVRVRLDGAGTLNRVLRVTTFLRFNASLLFPLGREKGSDPSGERMLPLTMEIPPGGGETELSLAFMAMLGDADQTPLLLDGTTIENLDADILAVDGRFVLTDVCREGGTRLVDMNRRAGIVSVSPHPVGGSAQLTYRAIERGTHRITLHDFLGRTIAVLVDGVHEPGEHHTMLNGGDTAAGLYQLLMSTPTGLYTRFVSILRR